MSDKLAALPWHWHPANVDLPNRLEADATLVASDAAKMQKNAERK